jgi:hypothetical protein
MKFIFATLACAALAAAMPVVDTSSQAGRDMVSKRRPQLDALTGLLIGGAAGGQETAASNPRADLLGGQ